MNKETDPTGRQLDSVWGDTPHGTAQARFDEMVAVARKNRITVVYEKKDPDGERPGETSHVNPSESLRSELSRKSGLTPNQERRSANLAMFSGRKPGPRGFYRKGRHIPPMTSEEKEEKRARTGKKRGRSKENKK